MSDYLWDKTGEPDEEVERLEALLGALAHTPRPLALPALNAHAAPARVRASRLFAPWALAAAAALLVAALAGAAALLRSREIPASKDAAVTNETRPSPEKAARESAAVEVKDERVALEDVARGPRTGKATRLASAQRRRKSPAPTPRRVVGAGESSEGGGSALEALSAGGGGASLFESARLMTKEQLVYALRLTGAKLRDVRQKTRQGLRQEASEQP